MPETKPTLTIEEEQRQRTEKICSRTECKKRDEIAEEVIDRINAQNEKKNGVE